MILFLLLVITEILTITVIRQHLRETNKTLYQVVLYFNSVLSIYLWVLYFRVTVFRGAFDEPIHLWLIMNLTGAFTAILFPRIILDLCHFTGVLIMIRKGGHIRKLTNAGIISSLVIFSVILTGSVHGKLNFKTEVSEIKIRNLNPSLEGLTIVQLSDLHLSGFYKHKKALEKVFNKVASYKPDIIINSGDFVSYSWKEFERYDTLFSKVKGKYGNFAVIGNHDVGTYNPYWNAAERDTNLARIRQLIRSSGYEVLEDEHTFVKIGQAKVAIIGVITRGRHPHMVHGDLTKAMQGTDSADLRILISHDPNHWEEAVRGKTNIELTLSGHTHGMQMGILTKHFKWSPSKYFYPRWSGLYRSGDQYLYVNRGLGVLAIPFRIGMPPEITVLRLSSER